MRQITSPASAANAASPSVRRSSARSSPARHLHFFRHASSARIKRPVTRASAMALDEARNSTVKAFPLVQGRETWGDAVEGLSVAELSRRNQTTILRAMASVSQARVSEVMGVSESTLSRMKDEQLERFSTMLAACGLAVRSCSDRSIEAEKLRALTVLARSALDDEIVNSSKD